MYIASSLPEYRASVIIKPIEEDMKVTNRYQKPNLFFGRAMCQFFTLTWFAILAIALISRVW